MNNTMVLTFPLHTTTYCYSCYSEINNANEYVIHKQQLLLVTLLVTIHIS